MSTQNIDYITLNGEEYEFYIELSNPDKRIRVPKLLFRSLTIVESLMDWEFRGHFDFVNDYEQIERFTENKNKKNNELFYFRMDGTDRITIYLKTTLSQSQLNSKTRKSATNPIVKDMHLTFTGAIYDAEDLYESSIGNKTKRLYFWDADYNKAVETVLPFSSGEYIRSEVGDADPSTMTDEDRAVSTGALLKYMFAEKLGATTSDTLWDNGISRIIYNAPANFTLNDTINYIFDRHVSKQEFPAMLMKNRFDNEFMLVSYDDIFSGYESQLKEQFSFPDNTSQKSSIGPARSNLTNTITFGTFSLMSGYQYNKMAGMDSMKAINTKSANWYDPVSKKFHTSIAKNTATASKKKFNELIENLNSSRSTALFPINKTKSENRSIEHRYISSAYNENVDLAVGSCETIRGALFLNDCISFSVVGLPHRTIGKFIDISSDVDLQGVWEDRFLGTWLTTSVIHNITPSTYTNEIVAVKPNATEGFDVPEDVEG